jgi:hypothetical protein
MMTSRTAANIDVFGIKMKVAAKSGDAKSGDAKSGDAKSGDAKSGDAKSGNSRSDSRQGCRGSQGPGGT